MNSNPESLPLADLLVVDDTPDNLRLLSTMLSEQGYKVRKVMSGQLALRVVSAAPPDLILLDINMPGMNGYEVCQKLKANTQTAEIPVIFISALDDVWDKVKAFEVGGIDYITKPFQGEEVVARVRNHLTLRSLSKQLGEQNARLMAEIRERQQAEEALRQSEAREREKSTQLELALQELKRTQTQLIQSEKMSSLGQMVAGFAHEINNPVSFIYGNLFLARQYFEDLCNLVKIYEETYPDATPEIQQIILDLDLKFVIEDWKNLMNSMQVGAERIQEVVLSLQHFSRLNKAKLESIDIHEGINTALRLLQHRLRAGNYCAGCSYSASVTPHKDESVTPTAQPVVRNLNDTEFEQLIHQEIQVIKEYGQLPRVSCYANQLNQVFLNLLNNAIDALENHPLSRKITIRTSVENREIRTETEERTEESKTPNLKSQDSPSRLPLPHYSHVVIQIADNGPGISEELIKKIFDPFFTTKTVGRGMGLGLATCYQIVVEQHGGQLSCVSTPGQGTEITVKIPVQPES
jgi:signal transduction histidine kinase